jgi:hypothetical protein
MMMNLDTYIKHIHQVLYEYVNYLKFNLGWSTKKSQTLLGVLIFNLCSTPCGDLEQCHKPC